MAELAAALIYRAFCTINCSTLLFVSNVLTGVSKRTEQSVKNEAFINSRHKHGTGNTLFRVVCHYVLFQRMMTFVVVHFHIVLAQGCWSVEERELFVLWQTGQLWTLSPFHVIAFYTDAHNVPYVDAVWRMAKSENKQRHRTISTTTTPSETITAQFVFFFSGMFDEENVACWTFLYEAAEILRVE